MKKSTLLFVAFLVLSGVSAHNAAAQTKRRVQFARGATSATLRGSVKGYVYNDYVFSARKGQEISITLDTGNGSAEIVVRNPSGENLSTGDASWTGEAPTTGTYLVRVLQPRATARRGESSRYTLTIEIK